MTKQKRTTEEQVRIRLTFVEEATCTTSVPEEGGRFVTGTECRAH
jgi:hypothetical protein